MPALELLAEIVLYLSKKISLRGREAMTYEEWTSNEMEGAITRSSAGESRGTTRAKWKRPIAASSVMQ